MTLILSRILIFSLFVALMLLFSDSSTGWAQSKKPAVPQFDTSDLETLRPLPESLKTETPVQNPILQTPSASKPALKPDGKRPTFQVGVQKTNVLPPEMYGDWSVTATLLDANNLALFAPVVSEIWRLEEAGNAVTLSNPNTGASATVSVDKVEGSKATFHRVQYGPNLKERISETPTLLVTDNEMVGITVNQMDFLRDGVVVKSYRGRYQIQAQRIGLPRVKFGPNRRGTPNFTVQELGPPEAFEITPIQRQTTPLKFPWLKQQAP
jgi:hypothetical protein